VIHVECWQCNHIFGDEEDEFGICPECGKQQLASGSWAKEEMSHIAFLESKGKYTEAVSDAMELLFMSTDIHYGDWPFAHKLAEIIRRLCKLGDLTEELAKHELHWKTIEHIEMGGDPSKVAQYESTRA
jgi:hypothetical protein